MNNQFSFEFADAVVVRESVGDIRIGSVSEGEASVKARCDRDGTLALDFVIPRGRDGVDGKDGKDGEGITPALYVKEIKTEPLINYNNDSVGIWTEYFMSDGTVRAEALVKDMNYSIAETYTDYCFLAPAYGPNCFYDPLNFSIDSVHAELYSCAKAVMLNTYRSKSAALFPCATLFRHGGVLPTGGISISYKLIAEGKERTVS
jgi:hypothetical protein